MIGHRKNIIYLTPFSPRELGNGGYQRSYQIFHDLTTAFPDDNVFPVTWSNIPRDYPLEPNEKLPNACSRLIRRGKRMLRNFSSEKGVYPAEIMLKYNGPPHIDFYQRLIQRCTRQGPTIAISTCAAFTDALAVNRSEKIPTILCPQNLDSLVSLASTNLTPDCVRTASNSFAAEILEYSKCDLVLPISRTEHAISCGIGLQSELYPYRPVGSVSDRFSALRNLRSSSAKRNFFLVLGNAGFGPTYKNMQAFIDNIYSEGNTEKPNLIFAGLNTDTLKADKRYESSIELLGIVSDLKLNQLLSECSAAIVPVSRGFGAITRLSDLSCAGVPVLTLKTPLLSIQAPPGVYGADNFSELIALTGQQLTGSTKSDYDAWALSQEHSWTKWLKMVT
jgi:hypothetical protein